MLTKEDIKRFDSIMSAVLQRREDRGFDVPDRDEDKIAEIFAKWDRSAKEENLLWLDDYR